MESLPEMLLLILEFQEAQFLVSFPPSFFFKDLPDDVAFNICNIATYHDDATLCLTRAPYCYLAMFDKLQKLECGEASSTPPASLRR